jgi:hypothetical protein
MLRVASDSPPWKTSSPLAHLIPAASSSREGSHRGPRVPSLLAAIIGYRWKRIMGHELFARSCSRLSVWGVSLSLSACVVSKEPLLGPDSRVLPFSPPMKFEVYERASARDAWKKQTDISLVADQRLVVRSDSSVEWYTFHPLGGQRFLVQAFMMKDNYAYGVLEIRNGEGFVSMMLCDNIDQRAFKAAGGTINQGVPVTCELDSASKPLELLKSIAARSFGPEQRYELRYVPVR